MDNESEASTPPTTSGTFVDGNLLSVQNGVGRMTGRATTEVVLEGVPAGVVRERRAAAAGAIAVREVVRETKAIRHDLTTCTARVVDSPAACRRVIRSHDELVTARADPQWSAIRDELLNLAVRIETEDLRKHSELTLVSGSPETTKQSQSIRQSAIGCYEGP